ncbi:MAG: sulfatase [Planctomycetes bacterium]|nr:sulfatase [Planctomycetota bacterium]
MGRPLLALASGLLLATSCGEGAKSPGVPPTDYNLVLLSIDTLRADRLGTYGNDDWNSSPSPSIDGLAERGVLFETAFAARGQTHPSISAMITGKYPITTGLRENGYPLAHEHATLFERLHDAGWQTGVFIANFEVDDPVESWVARGADVKSDGYAGRRVLEARMESRFQHVWDDRVEKAASDYLQGVDRTRPFAMWVHFYDVHKPYNPQPEDQHFGPTDGVPEAIVAPGPDSSASLEQFLGQITLGDRPVPATELQRILGLYDGGVAGTDRRVGRLLAQLEQLGELDSTYVVLTADHGEELFDHNRYFYHGASVYDGVVRIPLVIEGPGLPAGRRVPAHVQNVDIVPTVLDLLGVPGDDSLEGHSLAPLLRGETEQAPAPYAFIEWQDLITCVVDARYKLVYNPQGTHPRKSPYDVAPGRGFEIACLEGYDLQADPHEQVDLLADLDVGAVSAPERLPPEFRGHVAALRDFLADPDHQKPFDLDAVSDVTAERLRQIGYVATGRVAGGRRDSMQVGCY